MSAAEKYGRVQDMPAEAFNPSKRGPGRSLKTPAQPTTNPRHRNTVLRWRETKWAGRVRRSIREGRCEVWFVNQ
jgi:hypothetical protein